MSANAVRQAPGWWAALCRAECDNCGWIGPVRDTNQSRDRLMLQWDRRDHSCEYQG